MKGSSLVVTVTGVAVVLATYLGDAQVATGDRDQAKAAWRTGLELLPNGPGAEHVRQAPAS